MMGIKSLLIDKIERGNIRLKDKDCKMEFDFSNNTLLGITVSDLFNSLAKYELSENKILSSKGYFRYYFNGVEICIENGCIESIFLVWKEYLYESFTDLYGHFIPYQGICKLNGEEVRINVSTTEMEFIGIFGKPTEIQEDEYEIVLFYGFNSYEWQVIFSLNKQLLGILIVYK